MKPRSRGAASILVATGILVLLGSYVFFTRSLILRSSKFLSRYENTLEGFYWAEIALQQGLKKDREDTAAALAAGTPLESLIGKLKGGLTDGNTIRLKEHNSEGRTQLHLPSLGVNLLGVNLNVDLSLDQTAPLAFLRAGGRVLSYTIASGPLPRSVCGEHTMAPHPKNRICVYRAPPVPPGDPRVVICAQKLAQKGIHLSPAKIANPKKIVRNLLVGMDYLTGPIVDNEKTPEPSLVHIEVTSLVNVLFSLQLLNPNGLYCVTMSSLVNVFVDTTIDCHAQLVSSETRTLYDLFPSRRLVGNCK